METDGFKSRTLSLPGPICKLVYSVMYAPVHASKTRHQVEDSNALTRSAFIFSLIQRALVSYEKHSRPRFEHSLFHSQINPIFFSAQLLCFGYTIRNLVSIETFSGMFLILLCLSFLLSGGFHEKNQVTLC